MWQWLKNLFTGYDSLPHVEFFTKSNGFTEFTLDVDSNWYHGEINIDGVIKWSIEPTEHKEEIKVFVYEKFLELD